MGRHCLALLLLAAPLFAQAPSEHWKTISTAHFRFHYPSQYEPWTIRAASHIESVRDAVVREVGYSPATVTDILVMNPIAEPNGVTLPLLGHPRILLFTEPPGPEVAIGEFSSWIDLLTVHEMTHLVHLLRPSRNRWQRLMEYALPLNPITLDAPRWVLEGYATVIEGRITGEGRPSSSIRAAVLRKWAASGHLPTYTQLNSDRRLLGMSMAYLAGSAYLEWLEQRGGPDALRHLWSRMTARQDRSFNSSFEGVFGESPSRLYGIFTAELTQRAVDLDRTIDAREGELWLETKRASGEPAASPDGSQLAIVERNDKGEAKISVYSTGPNEEEKKLQERIAKTLQRDPEDVAPIRTKPVPRKAVYTLKPPDGGEVERPRWTRDGGAIVYTHKEPDRDGFLHDDLFVWNPKTKENRRLTHLADVKDADPLPDGRSAMAVRSRFGWSQLVKVDLTTGALSAFTAPSVDHTFSHPRAAADGRIAWAQHEATGWHIVVDGVARGEGYDPEWGRDGALYSVIAHGGFIDIARNGELVTRTTGALSQPAAAPDGSLYFMSLETNGYDLRRFTGGQPPPVSSGGQPPSAVLFVPAVPPQRATPVVFRDEPLPQPRDYGIGRQERGLAFGGAWTAYERRKEIGVRLGDVVGRLDTIAILANGSDRGAALASTWRGWPVAITAQAYKLRDQRGVEVRGEYEVQAPGMTTYFEAGTSSRAFAVAAMSLRQRKTTEAIRLTADSDQHARAAIGVSAHFGDLRLRVTAEAGRRLDIGGFASSVVPDSLRVARVDDPALPQSFAFAQNYRSARMEIETRGVTFFWRRYDLARNVDVRGVEFAMNLPSLGLLKTAGFDLTAGAAKVSVSRGVKGWIALRWRP